MRFWMILILLAAVAYAIWTWKKQHQKAEAKPVIDHHRQTMEKYLPKKKRR
jgi:lipopolysaccharide export system protein LptC